MLPSGSVRRTTTPGPCGGQPAREDALSLSAPAQRIEGGLPAVGAREQLVTLAREVRRLVGKIVAAVGHLVEDAHQVLLAHRVEVGAVCLAHLHHERETEQGAQHPGQHLRPRDSRLECAAEHRPRRAVCRFRRCRWRVGSRRTAARGLEGRLVGQPFVERPTPRYRRSRRRARSRQVRPLPAGASGAPSTRASARARSMASARARSAAAAAASGDSSSPTTLPTRSGRGSFRASHTSSALGRCRAAAAASASTGSSRSSSLMP